MFPRPQGSLFAVLAAASALVMLAGCSSPKPTATPVPTATAAASPTAASSPVPSATPAPTATPCASVIPTPTPQLTINTPAPSASATAAPTPAVASGAPKCVGATVTLAAQNSSAQPGTAIVEDLGGVRTRVYVRVNKGSAGLPQAVQVRTGTCASLGDVIYSLRPAVDGESDTTANVPVASLLTGKFVLNIQKSQSATDMSAACGPIPAR